MRKVGDTYKFEFEWKRPLGKHRCGHVINYKELGYEDVTCFQIDQDRGYSRVLVGKVIYLRVT
jgi:hypothetical protein